MLHQKSSIRSASSHLSAVCTASWAEPLLAADPDVDGDPKAVGDLDDATASRLAWSVSDAVDQNISISISVVLFQDHLPVLHQAEV